jgi:hypothetical protein
MERRNRKMSDNKKIVSLDDNNKLVIKDDNVVTTIEGITSNISGTYEISAEDVEKLLVLLNDKTTIKKIYPYGVLGVYDGPPGIQILTSDEAVNKSLSIVSKKHNELLDDYKELKDGYTTMKEKYHELLAKVKVHNKCSLFNKIKIEGGKQ